MDNSMLVVAIATKNFFNQSRIIAANIVEKQYEQSNN